MSMTTTTEDPRQTGLTRRQMQPLSLFDGSLLVPAMGGAVRKLDPRTLAKNPVSFCV
jgi:hypothetical protein